MRPWRDVRVIFVLAVLAAIAVILLLRESQPPTPTRARALNYEPVPSAAIVAFYMRTARSSRTSARPTRSCTPRARHNVDPGVLVAVTGQEQ